MAGHEAPYDPYIPSNNGSAGQNSGNGGPATMASMQTQIKDTVEVMRQNIQMVEDRGAHLDHIGEQADRLQKDSSFFSKRARKVHFREMRNNMKLRIWICLGFLLLIGIVVGIIVAVVKR